MKNNGYYRVTNSDKTTIGDIASDIWCAISGDKIVTGMAITFVLSVVGAVLDNHYSLKFDRDSVDLHPED